MSRARAHNSHFTICIVKYYYLSTEAEGCWGPLYRVKSLQQLLHHTAHTEITHRVARDEVERTASTAWYVSMQCTQQFHLAVL